MAKINLLPWRQERRAEQQKQLLSITGLSVVLIVLVIVAVHLEISRQINSQGKRNNYIKNEIAEVGKQLTEIHNLEKSKRQLLDRMKIIQQLQQNRPEVVHLFDEVARKIPEGVFLLSLSQNGKNLKIEGMAQSNARVSDFMRNISSSEWLSNPRLDVIEAGKNKNAIDGNRKFVLHAMQTKHNPKKSKSTK
ncbi:MAG: PilN domain-containing protein [Gammaproteobacteria bacterium]|nr:PilN domain-containing protein [Gammaproteobacteria bacterium]